MGARRMMTNSDGRVYTPDGWTIFHINNNGAHFYKVLCTWSGGYLDGDSCRLSSGAEDFNLIYDAKIGLFVSEQLSGSMHHLSRAGYQRHNVRLLIFSLRRIRIDLTMQNYFFLVKFIFYSTLLLCFWLVLNLLFQCHDKSDNPKSHQGIHILRGHKLSPLDL